MMENRILYQKSLIKKVSTKLGLASGTKVKLEE